MTKWTLFAAMGSRGGLLRLPDGRAGIVQAVERESGSGDGFNVRVLVGDSYETVYVRTED